jgi:hypothetical protein
VLARIIIRIDEKFPFIKFCVILYNTIFVFCKIKNFLFWKICVTSCESHVTLFKFCSCTNFIILAGIIIWPELSFQTILYSFGLIFRFWLEFQITAGVSDQGFRLLDSAIVLDNFGNRYNRDYITDLINEIKLN